MKIEPIEIEQNKKFAKTEAGKYICQNWYGSLETLSEISGASVATIVSILYGKQVSPKTIAKVIEAVNVARAGKIKMAVKTNG
jgi:hypothetical protein